MSHKNDNVVNAKKAKRVAMVIANPALSTTTGWPVGFWWSELTHPWLAFTEAGYEVEIFSPDGGKCEADGMSDPRDPSEYSKDDIVTMGFIASPHLAKLVEETGKVAEIAIGEFDAIMVAGGQAPMFTFDRAVELQQKFAEFYEAGKIAGVICHGVSLLRYTYLSSGELLAKGKTVTGFTNNEEDFADNSVWDLNLLSRDKHVMPWRIEDELKKAGVNYIQAGAWKGFAVRDGNLVTGQQNFSGREAAELIIGALGR